MLLEKKKGGNKTFYNVSDCSANNNKRSETTCDKYIDDSNIDHWHSGAYNFKQFSFLSIFIMLTSILFWHTRIIF